MVHQKYRTEPLDCYKKGKELRLDHFRDVITAKEKGKLLVSGSVTLGGFEIPAGLGDVICFADDAYAVTMTTNPTFSKDAYAAAEAKGFSRDICGYTMNYIGSMFLDRSLFGGDFPKADFIFTAQNCDARGKWSQIVADHLGIPFFVFERPCGRAGQGTRERIDYLVDQFNEGIEWMEKITGRRYDDEKLIEATRNFFRSAKLWGEIWLLNRTVPAPIDARSLISLMAAAIWRRHEKAGVDFLEILRDEIEYRVDNEIAASPTENCRLLLDNAPPFAAMPMLRETQAKYGIVWLGTMVYAGLYGELEILEDGTVVVAKTPEERGVVFRERNDAIRAIAEVTERSWLEQRIAFPTDVNSSYISLAKYLRADGILLDVNRGCPANSASAPERKFAFMDAGFPVTMYESNSSRPGDVDLRMIGIVIENLIENLMGLKKLQDRYL